MHKYLKRFTALLLVLVMALSLIPAAMAAEAGETIPPEETTADQVPQVAAEVAQSDTPEGIPVDYFNVFLDDYIEFGGNGFHVRRNTIALYALRLRSQPDFEDGYYVAYCVEPGIAFSNETTHLGSSLTYEGMDNAASIFANLTPAQIRAIGVVLLYGEKQVVLESDSKTVALKKLQRQLVTQILIWEIATGMRSPLPPYTRSDDYLYTAISNKKDYSASYFDRDYYWVRETEIVYDEIAAKVEQHYLTPSFAKDTLSFAPTYTMTTGSDGTHTITLTDTNNILSAYTFTNTENVQYTINGNQLTVTASGDISWPLEVAPTKQVPDITDQVFYVWQREEEQKMMSTYGDPTNDPVPCFFKLTLQPGNLAIKKNTEDGQNLSGWQFGIYSDGICTNLVSGPHTTDASGNISATGITPGTYWVKELGHTDAAVNSKYYCSDQNPKMVGIPADGTTSVSFTNKLTSDTCQIIKKATNGGSAEGWSFTVKDAAGNVVGNYTTDTSGIIAISLEPGTYTVTETGTKNYWINDSTATKSVTVQAGKTASVTFTNQFIGKAQIIKKATNGGSVEGWSFTVKNASGNVVGSYTTSASGIITLSLQPGTYTVTETNHKTYWANDPTATKTVTVKAGQTASVTFTNQWLGKAQIVKKATNGGSVEDWNFTVKNASGQVVGTYTTNSSGIITLSMQPGTYTVTEIGSRDYWENDPTPTRTITVKAGETASVTFTNQYLGKAQILKQATNGGSVTGWHFTVKDGSGNVVGNYVTDSSGIIALDLAPGTYTVTETDGAYEYWHNDPDPTKTLTVKAGETASVTFTNTWFGKAQIVKKATNGGSVEGWEFTVKDASGNLIGTYTTDISGIITLELEPGTYSATETNHKDYWDNDPDATKTVTVKPGETASITFTNQYLGKARIIKQLANPEAGSLDGWKFSIHRVGADTVDQVATVVTGADGTIACNLEPGTYKIVEALSGDSPWECISGTSQMITVTAGETAEATFVNALRSGDIGIQKVNQHGEPLEGVEFLLEWSQDGTIWQPVIYSSSVAPKVGGCTTTGLVNGRIVSDDAGMVAFSGLHPKLHYRLTETATLDGYQLLAGYAYEGKLPQEDGFVVSLRVVNNPGFTIPQTGSNDFVMMPPALALCIVTCLGSMLWLRRKEG